MGSDELRELTQAGCIQQDAQGRVDVEEISQARDDLRSLQRVTPQLEEPIVDTDVRDAKHFLPDSRNPAFRLRSGSLERRRTVAGGHRCSGLPMKSLELA